MLWPRTLTQLVCGLALATLGALAWLLTRWPDVGAASAVATAAVLLPALLLGALIAHLRPGNRIAPLLCLVGAVPLAVVALGDTYAEVVDRHPGVLPVWSLHAGLVQGSWMLVYVPAAVLMLTFPDGRLPGPRWRWVLAGVLAVPALFMVLAAMTPDPYPAPFDQVPHPYGTLPPSVATPLAGVFLVAFLALLAASASAVVVRHRRAADPVRRAQLKWLLLGAMSLPATLLLCWLSYLLWDGPVLVLAGLALLMLTIPAATAVAVLRHDLYDVDRAVSATVTWTAVTAVLLALFTTVEVAGGLLAGRDSVPVTAIATAVSALALAPVKARVQRWVDRRLYPRRHAVRTALEQLHTLIEQGRAEPEDLEGTLRTALHDPGLRVGYQLPGQSVVVDAAGAPLPTGVPGTVPVLLSGHPVGALLPADDGASRQLLRQAAAAAAVFMALTSSRLQLRRALDEVAASRTRLLRAGYEERRRLERDLHDGAQQRLVSLGMALRLAQRHLADGTLDIDGLIDQAVAELGTAVAELRTIAHGLRPASLAGGLAPAIRELSRTIPLPVRLEVCERPVPDDVATTVYFIASEALTNVVKHADATAVDLRIVRETGQLRIRVADDGRGGLRPGPGSGLAGVADRVAAAGGSVTFGDGRPRGAVVEAVLPCAP